VAKHGLGYKVAVLLLLSDSAAAFIPTQAAGVYRPGQQPQRKRPAPSVNDSTGSLPITPCC
jgi:hypothetical protein